MRDEDDEALALLRSINQGIGAIDVGSNNQQPARQLRFVDPKNMAAVETKALDDANADGSITLQPDGESKIIAEYAPDYPCALVAAGAQDEPDVEYRIKVDDEIVAGGWLASPHGSINSPFSFVDMMGGAIPAQRVVVYEARLAESAGSSIDVVARLFAEDL